MIERRRIRFIKIGFQTAFIAAFVLVAACSVAGSAFMMDIQAREALRDSMFRGHLAMTNTGEVILPVMVRVVGTVLAVYLACVLVLAIGALHHVGRELRKLDEFMARVRSGDMSARVTGAMWTRELAALANSAVGSMDERIERTRAAVARGRASCVRARESLAGGMTCEEMAGFVERVAEDLRQADG